MMKIEIGTISEDPRCPNNSTVLVRAVTDGGTKGEWRMARTGDKLAAICQQCEKKGAGG